MRPIRLPSALVVVMSLLTLASITLTTAARADQPHADRIAGVERGLRPAVTFEGDETWTIEERMEHYGVPGVSLAVIHDREVIWTKTYGVADREAGEPVRATTLFQAGSVSKPVAAFGAMLMVAAGRLDLDRNVNDYLQSWKLPDNEFTAESKVTLSHLLSHTGGVTVHGFPGYAVGTPVPTLVEVLDGSGPANTDPIRVDQAPGESWRYSGGGYTIAQQMMIDVSGQSFPKLMHDLVLEPLGMEHSTFEQPLPPELLTNAAAGVLPDGSPVAGKRHTYPEMAAAGLWTTPEDLALFTVEFQHALRGEGRVMSKETAMKMIEPVAGGSGRGWGLSRRQEATYFGHGGWDEGFCTQLTAHPEAGYGVVAMINSNHPEFLGELERAVAFEYGWEGYEVYEEQPVPEKALTDYVGRYRYNAELAFSIAREGQRLFLQYVGGNPEELLYVGDERYLRRERPAPITFTEGEAGVEFHFVLDDGGFQTHGRLGPDEVLPRELLATGKYDEALTAYRAILEEDPEEFAVSEGYLNGQGLSHLEDNPEHAIAILRVAADLYPDSANTWDSLGYAYRHAGDSQKAIEYYRMALERDPEFPSALEALAELDAEAGS